MYCNFCGKVIQDDAYVCPYCARKVNYAAPRHRLMRPQVGRRLGGVCAAVAAYFDLDVTLVRLVWLLTIFVPGPTVLAYIICWIVIPEEPEVVTVTAPANGTPQPGHAA